MSRNEIKHYYPEGLRHFSQFIRDAHRSCFKKGAWTNDTESVVAVLDCVVTSGGFNINRIARRFREWMSETTEDLSPVLRTVCNDPDWTEHPLAVCHKRWQESGLFEASAEATGRSLVTALTSSAEDLLEHTRKLVLMTNDDSRCVCTTVILAKMAHSLLTKGRETPIDELIAVCNRIDSRTLPFLKAAYDGDTGMLDLDDADTMSWTRKAMGAALWGLWHTDSAPDAIYKVIDQGGDTDSNAALAGMLAGLKYGYEALPEIKKEILRINEIDSLAERTAVFRREHGLD